MSPIRRENKDRYPSNWPEIRKVILERAEQQCEWCGVRNHALGYRDQVGVFHPEEPSLECDANPDGPRFIRIVLTIAHLDHNPGNNDPANLRALCQRCHNRHDSATRRRGIHERRTAKWVRLLLDPDSPVNK